MGISIKKIYQDKKDNCFQACLAMILGVELYQVPHFVGLYEGSWLIETKRWLKQIGIHIECYIGIEDYVGYYICFYDRIDKLKHGVIMKNHELIHDPRHGGNDTEEKIINSNPEYFILTFVEPRKYAEFFYNRGIHECINSKKMVCGYRLMSGHTRAQSKKMLLSK